MNCKLLNLIGTQDFKFGNKAISLAWLKSNGHEVPDSICFSFERGSSLSDEPDLEKIIESFLDRNKSAVDYIVRSSSPSEDCSDCSRAGYFKSIAKLKGATSIYNAISEIITHAFDADKLINTMGIIIQPCIEAEYSGVIFSSNPINWKRKEMVVSVTKGAGHQLVSGEKYGSEYIFKDNDLILQNGIDIFPKDKSRLIFNKFLAIANQYSMPCDIEWLMNKKECLFFLQIRPLTGVTQRNNKIKGVGEEFDPRDNVEKHNLRFFSKEFGLNISKAWSITICSLSNISEIESLISHISNTSNLFSIILSKPLWINGKIYRKFCKHKNIAKELHSLIQTLQPDFLMVEVIIKEILHSEYTGMIRFLNGFYEIEVARGHFIPKGITSVSYYKLDENYIVTYKKEVIQKYYYRLSSGSPKKIKLNQKVSISHDKISYIAKYLHPLFKVIDGVIEFGLTSNNETLVLDYSNESKPQIAESGMRGVISAGKMRGFLNYADTLLNEKFSYNIHFKDKLSETAFNTSKLIIWSEFPSLNLLTLVDRIGSKNLGFIFSELSLLCHLSIRLRELGIPAIWYNKKIDIYVGKEVFIDAETVDLHVGDRLIIL